MFIYYLLCLTFAYQMQTLEELTYLNKDYHADTERTV